MAGIYPLNGCLLYFPSKNPNRGEVKRAVKVKAYKRIRRGKVEKVRTHFRKY